MQLLHSATCIWLAVSEEGITVLSEDKLVGHSHVIYYKLL